MNEPYYWINEKTTTFLERGYLDAGQTPIERIKVIADRAEQLLGIKGFSQEFELCMSKGWFSLASPVWANFGKEYSLPISCITGDAWVNTKNGGKMAKDIIIGDELLTHRGRFRKVIGITKTDNRNDIFKIKICNRMTPIKITGNHQVLTNLGWVRVDELNIDRHLVATNGDVEYIEQDYVIDLTGYCDYEFQVENNKIEKLLTEQNSKLLNRSYSKNYSTPHAKIEIDNDLAWAFGLWFAEGSLTTYKGNPNGIKITLHTKEQIEGEKWLKIMSDKFNLNGGQYKASIIRRDRKNQHSEWLNFSVNSKVIGNYFASFGKNCKEKVLPDWFLELPKEKLQRFIQALVFGDGSQRKDASANKLTLSNPHLILQIYLIGLKLGLEMSLQMQEKPSRYNKTMYVYTILFTDYKLTKSRFRMNSGIKFSDGLVYSSVRSLIKTDLTKAVYDFAVEEDHSFSVSGVVVHNCNGSFISDDLSSILGKACEVGMMTKHGAGTSAYFGTLRNRGSAIKSGGKASGPVHYMELYDSVTNIVSQSNVRRGAFAAYLPVEHPDIDEFLNIRSEGHPIQNISIGVCVGDEWMQAMVDGDKAKRKIWMKIIQKRFESGYPYLFFTDTANRNKPQVYKDKEMKIHGSNVCNEIFLPSSPDESFVCDLSSLNLLHYDEWKSSNAVEILTCFLDAVMTEYIEKIKDIPYMKSAYNFAVRHRALGIGVLGWHSYLQSRMIAFESIQAKLLNVEIFKLIQEKSVLASQKLAELFGEPELLKGYGMRNTTTMAVAPTTSSSFILGQVSQSIEPLNSNYFVKDLEKGKFTYKNPYLKKVLKNHDQDTKEIWQDVLIHGGSVQHLNFLTQEEKDVFKTFGEISQKEIIIQAASRQKYIDQGQSLNIMVHPKTSPKEVNQLMIDAWKMGVKGLYYQRGTNAAQELGRSSILECKSCEG